MTKQGTSGLARLRGRGRRYSRADRERVLEYAARRRGEGVGLARIATEVGVAPNTLTKWVRAAPFVPVEVISVERGGVTVHGPLGIRIEGLSLSDIAELIRNLG